MKGCLYLHNKNTGILNLRNSKDETGKPLVKKSLEVFRLYYGVLSSLFSFRILQKMLDEHSYTEYCYHTSQTSADSSKVSSFYTHAYMCVYIHVCSHMHDLHVYNILLFGFLSEIFKLYFNRFLVFFRYSDMTVSLYLQDTSIIHIDLSFMAFSIPHDFIFIT